MTSASELFTNRRSRLGRNTTELGFDSSLDRITHHKHNGRFHHLHNNNNRRDRHDLDGSDPPRRNFKLTNPIHRQIPQERESVRLNQASSPSASGNLISSENSRNVLDRQRFSQNDRLPGSVLLARERLVERLRGVSPSGNRQSNRASSGIRPDDFTVGGNIRLADPEDLEIEFLRAWLALQETRKCRPPGLTQDALDRLGSEIYSNEERGDERAISRVSRECSICLESFVEGEKIVRLGCGHRFHSGCLDPWVRTCGDCPNCRTGIVVTSYRKP